ncbi:mucin-5AC [Hyalella azteca]|uniref:Mucin-5AC n=1 Tax=Hyalella azteca TaxID=294128 RepID=A0A8B7N6V7_HYAAZ|nr:mucin-5AC [Hyalella azteca]
MVVLDNVSNPFKMPSRVGVNLRASAYLHQGDRKYMEDEFVVAYQRTADKKDIEYAFFGIFDGHGGKEAAHFAKDHLMDNIVSQRSFWSDDDNDVLDAIREGFIQTHMAMWKVVEKWPLTASGWPSTSGSTASVAFIRKQKIYIGHVGDSGICLGYEDSNGYWLGEHLTKDHKPESNQEKSRITRCGGKVVNKSGVPRVVWNRPKRGHKGPVRRSTPMDEIPFLAVARSLGDLWSYNPTNNQFVVSPVPDVHVHPIDIKRHRCLIFGTDGLWNVMSPYMAVNIAYHTELNNENHYLGLVMPCGTQHMWVNPSRSVVKGALDRYSRCNLRADNTSAVVVFLDPPGRPKREVLLQRKGLSSPSNVTAQDAAASSTSVGSPAKSADCKVQVHVYNIDTNKSSKSTDGQTPHGLLRITERSPQKWQLNPESCENRNENDRAPIPQSPSKPFPKALAEDNEQASTPGTSELGTKRAAAPCAMAVNPLIAAKNSLASISTSTLSPLSSSLSSLKVPSSLPSLRSGGRTISSDFVASPAAATSQATRLSLCTKCDSPRRSSTLVQKKLNSHPPNPNSDGKDDIPSASIASNRAAKRERDEDETDQCFNVKKSCAECKCNDQLPLQPEDSRGDRTPSSASSVIPSDVSNASSVSHSLESSPKTSKSKSSATTSESSKVNRKRDDIQIPLISSSTWVSCNTSSSNSDASVSSPSATVDPASKLKLKKFVQHGSGDVVQVELVRHRTRSSVVTKPVPQKTMRSDGGIDTITSHLKTSSCSGQNANLEHKFQIENSLVSAVSCPTSEPSASNRILKSVNRGSPNETKTSCLKSLCSGSVKSSSSLKTSKYAFKVGKKKRSHSVPSLCNDSATALPPKKKSATMHLRSGKPMITRSQERGYKNVSK